MQLTKITTDDLDGKFRDLAGIYLESFPESERRPLMSIMDLIATDSPIFNLYAIEENEEGGDIGDEAKSDDSTRLVGLVSTWILDSALYVEHFAIDPGYRGNGLGGKAIDLLLRECGDRTLLLEVEPRGTSTEADRRIRFYERHGLIAHHDFDYMQPPYAPTLPSVPLTLMTSAENPDLETMNRELHATVYGVV